MNSPYLNRAASRAAGHHGRVSEKKVANRMGAKVTPGSGAMDGAKGDAVLSKADNKYLIESKATYHESLSVKKEWLDKIQTEALDRNAVPALTISFVTPAGTAKPNGEWVAIPAWLFKELTE